MSRFKQVRTFSDQLTCKNNYHILGWGEQLRAERAALLPKRYKLPAASSHFPYAIESNFFQNLELLDYFQNFKYLSVFHLEIKNPKNETIYLPIIKAIRQIFSLTK
jgi:capsule polysaccharide export protein KpsC/LpsZ